MPEHDFTLILNRDFEPYLDELFELDVDDASFAVVNDVAYVDFTREAPTLADALMSAIETIETVDDLQVTRIEPEDLVTATEIAERLELSRQTVSMWISGARRQDFPAPVTHLRTRNPLWRWIDITAWRGNATPEEIAGASTIAAVNGALQIRSADVPPAVATLVSSLLVDRRLAIIQGNTTANPELTS